MEMFIRFIHESHDHEYIHGSIRRHRFYMSDFQL